jgi:small subunit ribosomal protein S15
LRVCSASYKNKENVNLSKVPAFAKHENDVGSTEVQVARLTARVEQISSHLKTNRKDFSGQRGLQQVLSQRRKLLQYLYKSNRWVVGF